MLVGIMDPIQSAQLLDSYVMTNFTESYINQLQVDTCVHVWKITRLW